MTTRLRFAIHRRTHGRLSRLAVNIVDRGVIVKACSATYYGVQLTLAAIKKFVVDFPEMAPARVEVQVGDRELILHHPFAKRDVRLEATERQEPICVRASVPNSTVRIPNINPRASNQEQKSLANRTNKHLIAAGV